MACPSQNIQAKVPSPPSRSEEHVCPHQSLKRTSDQLGSGDWFGQVTAPQREPLNMSMYELLKSWPLASHHRSELAHTQSRQNPWTRKGFPSTNNIEVCLELIYVSVFHVAVLSSVTVFFLKRVYPWDPCFIIIFPVKMKKCSCGDKSATFFDTTTLPGVNPHQETCWMHRPRHLWKQQKRYVVWRCQLTQWLGWNNDVLLGKMFSLF